MSWWTALAGLLVGCGGGGSGGPPPACTILGQSNPTALVAGEVLQVQLEVKFLNVEIAFMEGLGVDFASVAGTESADPPGFGGKFEDQPTYLVGQGVIADLPGGNVVVPEGHRPGSYLPNAYASNPPQVGQAASFVQAPGLDDQCLGVDPSSLAALAEPALVPAATAIVPQGILVPGTGLAYEILDDVQVSVILNAIAGNSAAAAISAPRLQVYDQQRSINVMYSGSTSPADLLDIVQTEVYGGASIATVRSGIVLDVRPTISADRRYVRLEIRPSGHAVVAELNGTRMAEGTPLTVQVPALIPSTVKSTVSVPDGGTIVIGGIKNLSDDGQTGVPLLGKIPYVNRLFKGTSPLSTSQDLMIMVTPRILDNR